MAPLVSVVIPVYNCEGFVAEAVRSVLEQDHKNIEILAIDDGSRDASVAVLRSFGDAVDVIQVPNGGPARARNLGMDRARGKYIAFLDADDVWLPRKLSDQVRHLEAHPEVGVCYTGWHVWRAGADGAFVRPDVPVPAAGDTGPDLQRSGWIYGRLLFDCELLTTTVMLRSETAHRVGRFDPGLPLGEDYDYWLRLSRAAPISRLARDAALYRVLPGSASRKAHERNFELEVVTQAVERFGLHSPDGSEVRQADIRQRLDRLLLQHGHQHLQHGNPEIAWRSFSTVLRRQPWRWRLWARAAQALLRRVSGPTSPGMAP